MQAGYGPDALRVEMYDSFPSWYVDQGAIGALDGVAVTHAGGRCGEGHAYIESYGTNQLRFRAPGSSSYGPAVTIPADGEYVLTDGDDGYSHVRVYVDLDRLASAGATGRVVFRDRYDGIAGDMVSAAEAVVGDVEYVVVRIKNVSSCILSGLSVWYDAADTSGYDLALAAGGPWVDANAEGSALDLPDLAPLPAYDDLYVRRTIGAGASMSLNKLCHLKFGWDGL